MLHVSVCGSTMGKDNVISKEDTTPIAVIIPGLTSDSASVVSCRHLTAFTYTFGWKYYVQIRIHIFDQVFFVYIFGTYNGLL